MKKLFCTMLTLFMILSLCACGSEASGAQESPEPELIPAENVFAAMDLVASDAHIFYYRDAVTNVMYLCYSRSGAGGLTPMVNPETGLPLTYEAYSEMLKSYHPVEDADQPE